MAEGPQDPTYVSRMLFGHPTKVRDEFSAELGPGFKMARPGAAIKKALIDQDRQRFGLLALPGEGVSHDEWNKASEALGHVKPKQLILRVDSEPPVCTTNASAVLGPSPVERMHEAMRKGEELAERHRERTAKTFLDAGIRLIPHPLLDDNTFIVSQGVYDAMLRLSRQDDPQGECNVGEKPSAAFDIPQNSR
jgi:hypothetical protein